MSPELIRNLIGLVFFALGGLAMLLLWWLRRPSSPVAQPIKQSMPLNATPDEPIAFGYKISWLAIRSTDTNHVAHVVGLTDLQPANWETGLEAAIRGERIFVSPPVEGWVFVAGICGREPAVHMLAAWEQWMNEIAAEFSEVHYFGSHQVSDFYAWARYVDGRALRAYSSAGEVYVDRGSPAAAEQAWRQSGESDDCAPDEEDVLRVAAEWGFNPMTLEDRDYPHGVGIVGRLSH